MRTITPQLLRTLGVAFNDLFKDGLGAAPTDHMSVCTVVPSSTKSNEFGWLGNIPGVREWVGDRVKNALKGHGYTITNKDWEDTVTVDRNDIEDDNLGIYTPLFAEMGRATGTFPCELVFGALLGGFANLCYDGQNFFDTDHTVLDANGQPYSVANTDAVAGTGPAWFLIDDTRAIKPIILQKRKDWQFIAKDKPDDDNVFERKEFVYGVDARMNVGYGLWQFAWGSKADLTADSYADARAALANMKGDYGRKIGVKGTRLIVGPELEKAGRQILVADKDASGATNVWAGSATLQVSTWASA